MKLCNFIKQLQKFERKYGSDIDIGFAGREDNPEYNIYKCCTWDIGIDYVEEGAWGNTKPIIHINVKDDKC